MKRVFLFLFALGMIFAAAASAVTVSTDIPGVSDANSQTYACSAVFGFYKFALMIGGVLALGAITYGGVKYTLAAGNPAGQSEGKEWVKGALLGLLLLVGAWLILNVINPDLTKCTVPTLQQISAPSNSGGPVEGPVQCGPQPDGSNLNGLCPTGLNCVNQGVYPNNNYQCISSGSVKCEGTSFSNQYCQAQSANLCCVNSGGNTPSTVNYRCATC